MADTEDPRDLLKIIFSLDDAATNPSQSAKLLKEAVDRNTRSRYNQTLAFLKHDRVMRFLLDLVRLPHFRTSMASLKVTWLEETFIKAPYADVVLFFFQRGLENMLGSCTNADLITEATLQKILDHKALGSTKNKAVTRAAQEENKIAADCIFTAFSKEAGKYRETLFAGSVFTESLMKRVDDIYKTTLRPFIDQIGSDSDVWQVAMQAYSDGILDVVENEYGRFHLMPEDEQPMAGIEVAQAMLWVKLKFLLTQFHSYTPLPLITRDFIIDVVNLWVKVEEGTKEVLKWVEPLADWNLLCARGKKKYSGLAAMVRKNIQDRIIDEEKERICSRFYTCLWKERSTRLGWLQVEMQLHGAGIKRTLAYLKDSEVQRLALPLIENAKEYFVNTKWPEGSSYSLTERIAQSILSRTAWDWSSRHSHNRIRDLKEVLSAACAEALTISKYRHRIFQSPAVYRLRFLIRDSLSTDEECWVFADDPEGNTYPQPSINEADQTNNPEALEMALDEGWYVLKAKKEIQQVVNQVERTFTLNDEDVLPLAPEVHSALKSLVDILCKSSIQKRWKKFHPGEVPHASHLDGHLYAVEIRPLLENGETRAAVEPLSSQNEDDDLLIERSDGDRVVNSAPARNRFAQRSHDVRGKRRAVSPASDPESSPSRASPVRVRYALRSQNVKGKRRAVSPASETESSPSRPSRAATSKAEEKPISEVRLQSRDPTKLSISQSSKSVGTKRKRNEHVDSTPPSSSSSEDVKPFIDVSSSPPPSKKCRGEGNGTAQRGRRVVFVPDNESKGDIIDVKNNIQDDDKSSLHVHVKVEEKVKHEEQLELKDEDVF